jgi:hypothetical protein
MASTTSAPAPRAGDPWPPSGRSGKISPGRPRRRRRVIVLAVILVAGGAVANTLLWVAQDDQVAVLALARPVAWKQPITDADVVVLRVAKDPRVAVISESQRGHVIGKYAAANLEPGMLVSPGLLSDEGVPAHDQQLVSVLVRPGALPARGLRPGDAVLVVVAGTPAMAAGSSDRASPAGVAPVPARVAQVSAPATDGSVTVDVAVSNTVGPQLAAALVAAGAERRAALVLLPAGS